MINLFDPDFYATYSEDDVITVYRKGVEITHKKVSGILDEKQLRETAAGLLSAKYDKTRYYTQMQIAEDFDITRMMVSMRMKELVRGYHYLKGGTLKPGVLITQAGYDAFKKYYEERRKTS